MKAKNKATMHDTLGKAKLCGHLSNYLRLLWMSVIVCAISMIHTLPTLARDPEGIIVIGTEGRDKPWNFITHDAKLDGMEIDLMKLLCQQMDVECKIISQEWSGLIPSLMAGKIDAIIGNMHITEERLKIINFTAPYAEDTYRLLVRKDDDLVDSLKSLGDEDTLIDLSQQLASKHTIERMKIILKGRTIGTQTGTSTLAFLRHHLGDTVEVKIYSNREQHELDLAVSRIDAVLVQQATYSATQAAQDNSAENNFILIGPAFSGGILGLGVGIGVRKLDLPLQSKLNKTIASSIADGKLKKLFIKWFGRDLTPRK